MVGKMATKFKTNDYDMDSFCKIHSHEVTFDFLDPVDQIML